MDRVNKLVQLLLLMLRQRARLLVAARKVNVHIGGHFESRSVATGKLVCSCGVLYEGECGGADGEDSVGEDARLWRDC